MRKTRQRLIATLCLPVLLAGCNSLNSLFEKKIDYRGATKLPPLEVPPDLTRPGRDDRYALPESGAGGSATYSQYNAERGGAVRSGTGDVLPSAGDIQVARDGDTRYLIVPEPPEKVWPVVRDFWQETGFALKIEMPDAGVMETDWAENYAKIPQDPLRNVLGKLLDQIYSTGERDKFRTRLERTADGRGTEIYVSHRGMVEQVYSRFAGDDSTNTVWQPRPPDPELEAEFLRRLMVKLGVDDARAKAQLATGGKRDERAKLVTVKDGAAALDVTEPFDRAWRRVGLALDRVGFTVEDRDRAQGIYFVRYVDPAKDTKKPTGILDRIAFWRSTEPAKAEQYRVLVTGGATDASQVQVLNKDGAPDASGASKKILGLLYEQLK
jgi:outer membrane protein assembly factor BamC